MEYKLSLTICSLQFKTMETITYFSLAESQVFKMCSKFSSQAQEIFLYYYYYFFIFFQSC